MSEIMQFYVGFDMVNMAEGGAKILTQLGETLNVSHDEDGQIEMDTDKSFWIQWNEQLVSIIVYYLGDIMAWHTWCIMGCIMLYSSGNKIITTATGIPYNPSLVSSNLILIKGLTVINFKALTLKKSPGVQKKSKQLFGQ